MIRDADTLLVALLAATESYESDQRYTRWDGAFLTFLNAHGLKPPLVGDLGGERLRPGLIDDLADLGYVRLLAAQRNAGVGLKFALTAAGRDRARQLADIAATEASALRPHADSLSVPMGVEEPRYWHVIVEPKGRRRSRDVAVVVDQDRGWIDTRIIEPRRRGEPIVVAGRQFDWPDIERIRITASDEPSAQIIARLRVEDQQSSVAIIGGPSFQHRAAARSKDYTDVFVNTPVGSMTGPSAQEVDRKKVMVVHGRDEEARRAVFDFLRALGLAPQEWSKLVASTGSAAPYIGQVLDRAFAEAAAVVVLFTPDDEARLRQSRQGSSEPEYERELTPQARPNVLFEAGMALGIHPDRTLLVELGRLRPFSDVYGRHVVRLDGTERPLRDIAERLRTAGCDVDTSGNDWADPTRFPKR